MFENANLEASRHRPNKNLEVLFGVFSRISFGTAGVLFLFGGGLLHAVANTDRMLGEMIGIGLAFVCCAAGLIAKSASENCAATEDDSNST